MKISFYERLLKENPRFVNALIALGGAYSKRGRYHDGLAVDQRLVQLKPDDPIVHYNLACSYSLLQMLDPCLDALGKSLSLGYRDFDFISSDPDLQFAREDPRFKTLIYKYNRKDLDRTP